MRSDQPPHIFWVADKALQRMRQTRSSQTILVSGESGSGKTESTKLLIEHLAHSCPVAGQDDLVNKILEVGTFG